MCFSYIIVMIYDFIWLQEEKTQQDRDTACCLPQASELLVVFGHLFNSLKLDALFLYKLVRLVWTTTFPPVWSQLWTCISRVIPTIRWCRSFYNSVRHMQSRLLFSKMIPASAVFPHRWHTVGEGVEIVWGVRSWGSTFGGRRLWKQWRSCRHGCWSRM